MQKIYLVFVSLFLIEERRLKKEGQLEEEKGKEKNMEKKIQENDSRKKKGGKKEKESKEKKRKEKKKKIKSFVQKEVCFSVMVHLIP